MYEDILKALRGSLLRGGDDFDIVERASIRSMSPRMKVKAIYDRMVYEDKRREAS